MLWKKFHGCSQALQHLLFHYSLYFFQGPWNEQIWHHLQDLDDDPIEHVKLLYILQCISKSWKKLVKDDNI